MVHQDVYCVLRLERQQKKKKNNMNNLLFLKKEVYF